MQRILHQTVGALAAYGAINSILSIGFAYLKRKERKFNFYGAALLFLFGLHCGIVFYRNQLADSIWNRNPFLDRELLRLDLCLGMGMGMLVLGELWGAYWAQELGLALIIVIFPVLDAGVGGNRRYLVFLRESRSRAFRRSRLEGVDEGRISSGLSTLMVSEKIYLDEELSLGGLAERLGVHSHMLSEFLNRRLGKKFQHYVNGFRVQEACVLLREEKTRTVLSVAYMAGFNSKTAFQAAFRRETGMTPGEYRKRDSTSYPLK